MNEFLRTVEKKLLRKFENTYLKIEQNLINLIQLCKNIRKFLTKFSITFKNNFEKFFKQSFEKFDKLLNKI